MIARRPWADDREHRVKLYSVWVRRLSTDDRRWKVTELFRYETGQGDVLSVRIRHVGRAGAVCRRMSEARFLQQFAEVE